MEIAWVGVTFAGLMWGWLIAPRAVGSSRPLLNSLVLIGASLLLGAGIALKVDSRAAIIFLVSVSLAFCGHLAWRRHLSRRFGA